MIRLYAAGAAIVGMVIAAWYYGHARYAAGREAGAAKVQALWDESVKQASIDHERQVAKVSSRNTQLSTERDQLRVIAAKLQQELEHEHTHIVQDNGCPDFGDGFKRVWQHAATGSDPSTERIE